MTQTRGGGDTGEGVDATWAVGDTEGGGGDTRGVGDTNKGCWW